MNERFDGGDTEPDVLIVGAGAVGLVLGIALARAGRRVLIVEAGPSTPSADFMTRNAGSNTGVPHLGLTAGRLKAVGGTTRLWGGQLVAFGPSDFRDTYVGKPAWPIDHAALAPYFDRAFDFLGVPMSARDPTQIWARVAGGPIDLGPAFEPTMNIWLPIADFAKLFAADIAGLANLRIVADVEAAALQFDSDGRATGLLVRSAHAGEVRLCAPQIVLACGTMEIARLLLRSAATAPNCPFAGNEQIGRGFIDHLHGIVGRIDASDLRRLRAGTENILVGGRKYSVKLRASDAFLEQHRIANCAATFNATGSIRQAVEDIAQLGRRIFAHGEWRRIGATMVEAARTLRVLAPVIWNYVVWRRSHSLFDRGILLGVEIEQIPTAASYMFLDSSKAPREAAIGVHWGFDGREIDAAATFCTALADSFAAHGLGTIDLDPRLIARDPSLFDDLHDAFHHMGGARMAETPEDGVVDRDLRVFGCSNLSVLGAAVFPSGSFANPTLTAIALALRLADRLTAEEEPSSC